MGPELATAVAKLARRQHGLVCRRQLLELGFGAERVKSWRRGGRLTNVQRGVYAVGVPARSRHSRWMAAVLGCGPGVALSHLSAATLWALRPIDPAVIDLSVLTGRSHTRAGLRIHRPRELHPSDVTTRDAIPVTTVSRTLIDLAATVSTRTLERALDEAEYLNLFNPTALGASFKRAGQTPGAAKLRRALHVHTPGTTRTRSKLEEALLALVRTRGLPQPEVNARLGPYEVDFLWRERRLVVETDGRAAHERARARERDASRDAWLAAHGFQVLRLTWSQVTERAEEVAAALGARLG